MEFETRDTSGDADHATIQHKLVVTPLHEDVTEEYSPDDQVENQHLINPAIANISTDTEVTGVASTQPQPSAEAQKPAQMQLASKKAHGGIVVAVIALALIAAGIAAFAVLR